MPRPRALAARRLLRPRAPRASSPASWPGTWPRSPAPLIRRRPR